MDKQLLIAWAAGVFEGEGTITPLGPIRKDGTRRWALRMSMTDEDVVFRVAEAFSIGRVYGPYRPAGNAKGRNGGDYKPIWIWSVNDKAGFDTVAPLLLPWLGSRRRERLEEAIRGWGDAQPRTLRTTRPFRPRPQMVKNVLADV